MNASIQHPNHPRNLFRVIAGIFSLALIFALLAMATGCTGVRKVVTAEVVIRNGTNEVRITQPKDTTIDRLRWNGLELDGYASAANAEAIAASKAQAEALSNLGNGFLKFTDTALRAAAASRGIQVPQGQTDPPPGMKWTLAPVDDPSRPQPEITNAPAR